MPLISHSTILSIYNIYMRVCSFQSYVGILVVDFESYFNLSSVSANQNIILTTMFALLIINNKGNWTLKFFTRKI